MGWRAGVAISLLLPPHWQLVCMPLFSITLATTYARYGVSSSAGVIAHAAQPFRWGGVAAALVSPQFRRPAMHSVAGLVLTPLAISLSCAWLARQQAEARPGRHARPPSCQHGSGASPEGASNASSSARASTSTCPTAGNQMQQRVEGQHAAAVAQHSLPGLVSCQVGAGQVGARHLLLAGSGSMRGSGRRTLAPAGYPTPNEPGGWCCP